MSRAAVLELLSVDCGLDPASLGDTVLDHALADARREFGVTDDAALLQAVQGRPAHWRRLRELFLVPETWFFRAPTQFADLCRHALGAAQARRPFRVLSLPCASGEEAASAAIALQQAGLLAADIEVVGIDLSEQALARARAGRYPPASLRRHDPGEDWLPVEDGERRLAAGLRRCLHFEIGNALDPRLLLGDPGFDAIFCRNLLIYLHTTARAQVLANLLRLARQPALLLAGHAENLAALDARLQPLVGGDPSSFLLGVEPSRSARPASPPAAERPSLPTPPRPKPSKSMTTPAAPPGPAAAIMVALPAAPTARALADAGRLEDARQACLGVLEQRPDDVEHRFLLGMLDIAAGQLEAAEAELARVLYLEPGHRDALEHRLALARRRGEQALAQRLQARLQRLPRPPESSS